MRLRIPLLYLTVLVISTCGLVYELLAGTLASYVLGDSVTQFSITIGTYLFAMGIGSYLSRFVRNEIGERFIEVELATALLGGFSAPLLFIAFAHAERFEPVLYGTILSIGTLVGLEIPLLMRILKEELAFEDLVARVLAVDYVGALVGSVLFAIVLVPRLGIDRTSLLFGLLNGVVGLAGTWALGDLLTPSAKRRLRATAVVVLALLASGFVWSARITAFTEQELYADPIVSAVQSPYQRIVVTRGPRSVQLFLNGNLQFSSSDEYRYHEALVHPAFAAAERRAKVLVLGGGDGLAMREIYRYPEVESVTLVDLDRAVTDLAGTLPLLRDLNERAFDDPRTHVVHDDAMAWLAERRRGPFDVIIIDFPDPNNFALGKLYTGRFYALLQSAMHEGSAVAVQSTSPLVARKSFWCVIQTMEDAGFTVHGYHANVPAFGEWGYALARLVPFEPPTRLARGGASAPLHHTSRGGASAPLRYLDDATLAGLFVLSPDMSRVPVESNRLNDQMLVRYYEDEWANWN
jgi:spermidine synthase